MRVTLLGGYTYTPQGGDAVADTETFDAERPADGWTLNGAGIPRMNVGRSYGNVVQLPDGGLVAIGGGAGQRARRHRRQLHRRRRAPQAGRAAAPRDRRGAGRSARRSASGARTTRPRCCCPTAGSCRRATTTGTSATQARPQGGSPMDVGEIYSPPYLFDGDQLAPRPLIEDAPVAVPYGAPFGIRVRDAARAVLVAPGATTHGADINQRLIVLETLRTRDGVGLDVRAPSGPGAAPPGYYMLFVLDNAGTPSVARWVRVAADAPPPAVLPDPAPGPSRPPRRPRARTAPPRA